MVGTCLRLGSSTTSRERLTSALRLTTTRYAQVPLEVHRNGGCAPGYVVVGRTRVRLCNTTGTPQVALRWSCGNEHAAREVALDALADLSSLCRVAALPGPRVAGNSLRGSARPLPWVSPARCLWGYHTAELGTAGCALFAGLGVSRRSSGSRVDRLTASIGHRRWAVVSANRHLNLENLFRSRSDAGPDSDAA